MNWAKSILGDEKRAVQRSENDDAPASEHLINLRHPHPQLPYTDVTPTNHRVSKKINCYFPELLEATWIQFVPFYFLTHLIYLTLN